MISFFNLTGKIPLVIIFFPSRGNLDEITKLEWLCITSWYASKCREGEVCRPFSDQMCDFFLPIPQPWTLMASHARHVLTQKAILAFARLLFFCSTFPERKERLLVVHPISDQKAPRLGWLTYERDGDARRKIRNRTLKETHLGVAQALFDPEKGKC